MKKNLYSILLAITIFLTMVYIPVSAHQDFSFSTNFSGYENKTGLWDGKTVVTSTVAPDSDSTVGTFASYSSIAEYNGMTSGTPEGNTRYGTSLKTVQSKQSGSSYYGGALFSFAAKNRPSTSFLLETSVYIEEVTEGNIMPRIIRVKQYGGSTAYFAEFDKGTNTDGGNLRVFGTNIGKYYPNRWYDIKIWFNPQTTEYKVIVLEDGKDFYSGEGTHTAFNYLTNVQRIELFHAWSCDRMANSATHNVPATQITYWDNFKIESIYRFELPDNLNTFDFEGFKDVSDMTGADGTDIGTLGSWKIGYGGNGGVDITPVTTDKGTSIRVFVPAEAAGVVNSTASQTARYPRIYYDLSPKISDTAYIKGSVKFEDDNIYRFSCSVTNDYSMWCILSANSIKAFGETVDTGMTFRKNTWYDFECMLDIDTGYGSVYLTDGTDTFSKSGFVPKAVEKKGTAANRFLLLHNGRMNYQEKTSFIVDNLVLGSIDKMAAPVSASYDFSSDSHKNAFVVTGGTTTINNNIFVLNGATDNQTATVATMALPFANTDFVYSADINLEDMNADRTVSAVINGETVEIVNLGANGTLSIGDTSIENATVSTGSYSLKLTVEQSKGKVNVSVSKGGSVIADESANLSDNAVSIASVDIASSASTQAAVTSLDNISYNTIYAFEIDTKASTTGDEVVVWKDDSVTARFTNKINRTTLTKDDILVNKSSGCITELTYIDDYTVSINFPKKQGQHYHIDFVDIEDINGTVASPFIEFDVMSQDLEISKVGFFRNGEALSLSTAGNVTATFTAKANNGTSFDMIYMLGMYQSGVLVDAAWNTFTVGENMESHSLNLTVPDDGKYYVVKAYVWDNHSFKPYLEPSVITPVTDKPVVIVKFDDLGGPPRLEAFEEVVEWAEENQIKMSFGLIGEYLDSSSDDTITRLKAIADNPLIEMWYHAYDMSATLGSWTNEQQDADFEAGMTAAGKYGFEFTAFNAPSNSINSYTAEILNRYNFKAVMSTNSESDLQSKGFMDDSNTFTTLYKHIKVEMNAELADGTKKTVVRHCDELKADWEAAKANGYEYVFLQSHPYSSWNIVTDKDGVTYNNAGNHIYDFLLWLKNSEGVVFMTPSEYVEYAKSL